MLLLGIYIYGFAVAAIVYQWPPSARRFFPALLAMSVGMAMILVSA
jgi:hypothetical protein